MKFELSHDRRNISDEVILQDMKRAAEIIGNPTGKGMNNGSL